MLVGKERYNLDGRELLLRCPAQEDAAMLIDYLKTTCGETPYLSKEPEEVLLTLEEEKEFIRRINVSKNSLMLLAFLDGQFIGNGSFLGKDLKREQHRATLGIALFQKYTGMGIGGILIKRLCEIAKEWGFEQMELQVIAKNERAVHLYRTIGFQIYGTFPDSAKYKDGTYADTYWMMKKL